MKNWTLSRRIAAIAAAAGALVATAASAQLITSTTPPGLAIFGGGGTVPLATTFSFPLLAGERFVVTFSADCSVLAPAGDFDSFTDVDIVVLAPGPVVSQTLMPTAGLSGRFCSGNGTPVFDGHARNSITAVGGGLPAGVYQVQVRGRMNGPAGSQAWYGDRSLVVSR